MKKLKKVVDTKNLACYYN